MSQPAGIRRADRFAVIDVGSNSVKLSIAVVGGRRPAVIETARIVTQLGEGAGEKGKLASLAIKRTAEAVAQLAAEAREQDADEIRAVATSAAREASNANDLIEQVKRASGIDLEVISGAREAELVFQAVRGHHVIQERESVVFDTGGGSTELIRGHRGKLRAQCSTPLGALRLTQQFKTQNRVGGKTLAALRSHVAREVERAKFDVLPADVLVGTGGTCTALALMDIGPLPIVRHAKPPTILRENHTMSRSSIEELLQRLRKLDASDRKRETGLGSRRTEIIVAGIGIVAELMSLFETEWISLMDVGLRDGLLREMMS